MAGRQARPKLVEGGPEAALDPVSLHGAADLSGDGEAETRFLFRLVGPREGVEDEVARRHATGPSGRPRRSPASGRDGCDASRAAGQGLRPRGACGPWRGGASESPGRPGSASGPGIHGAASSGGRSVERFASRDLGKEEVARRRPPREYSPAARAAPSGRATASGEVRSTAGAAHWEPGFPQVRARMASRIALLFHTVETGVDNAKDPCKSALFFASRFFTLSGPEGGCYSRRSPDVWQGARRRVGRAFD